MVYRLLWFCFGVIVVILCLFVRHTVGTELSQQELDYLEVLTSGSAPLGFLSGSLLKSLSFVLMGHKFLRKFQKLFMYWDHIYRDNNSITMKNVFKKL